jgi:hypothetical protein
MKMGDRFPEIQTNTRSLIAGFLALALSVCAVFGLAVALQSQTLVEYIESRDKVSGSVYIALLVFFALMPRLRLPKVLSFYLGFRSLIFGNSLAL